MTIQHNAFEVAAVLQAEGDGMQRRADRVTRHHAMLLETRVKANASLPRSGPPGPRLITGDYVRSWTTTRRPGPGGGQASVVGTNKPQARRLEFGFIGADSLGRVYNQPPYPHLGPAVDATKPGYVKDLAELPRLRG